MKLAFRASHFAALLALVRPLGPEMLFAQLTDLGADILYEDAGSTGTTEDGDEFGSTLAVGDFDNDGFADLAVGIPGETSNGAAGAGAVHVFYGSPGGLALTGDQVFSQQTSGIADSSEAGDHFGFALAVGDFNADTFDDLAVSAPDENLEAAPGSPVDAGAVWILFGSASGLTATGSLFLDQGFVSPSETAESDDRFGYALAAGYLNSGVYADLVIGVPREDLIPGLQNDAGKMHVLYMQEGLVFLEQEWTEDIAACRGVFDRSELGDQFGRSLVVSDLNGDGFDDLAVGSPFEEFNATLLHDPGEIHVFYSFANGVGLEIDCFGQVSTVVDGSQASDDWFGLVLAGGDWNGDGFDDLAVGAPGKDRETSSDEDAGAFVALPNAAGSTGFGIALHVDEEPFIGDNAEDFDYFASAFAAGDFDGDGFDDLAVGAPSEDVNGTDAGDVGVLYGGASGLSFTASQIFHSDAPAGMPDFNEPFDQFGAALAAGDFDGNGSDDLAIGVPGEDVNTGGSDEGMVTVLYGLQGESGAFGTVQFGAAGGASFPEEQGTRQVFVARTGGAVLFAEVDHARSGGTAAPGVDFVYSGGTEDWSPGQLTPQAFGVVVNEDTLDEENETLVIELSNPSAGLALGTPSTFTFTIVDDDEGGVISLTLPVYVVSEVQPEVPIGVARQGGAASGVLVDFSTAAGTAGPNDFLIVEGDLAFDAGETLRTFHVPILDDDLGEGHETVIVTISDPQGGATLGAITTAVVVILDDELIFADRFESGSTSAWDLATP